MIELFEDDETDEDDEEDEDLFKLLFAFDLPAEACLKLDKLSSLDLENDALDDDDSEDTEVGVFGELNVLELAANWFGIDNSGAVEFPSSLLD